MSRAYAYMYTLTSALSSEFSYIYIYYTDAQGAEVEEERGEGGGGAMVRNRMEGARRCVRIKRETFFQRGTAGPRRRRGEVVVRFSGIPHGGEKEGWATLIVSLSHAALQC